MHLRGQVDVLPVCNPMAYAAETRFTPGSDRDMARAFTASEPVDISEAIAQAIMSLAEEAEVILNLHSAGEARYLPHVLFYREEDAAWAASLGFPFAIKRGTPESLAHHIFSYLRPGQRTLTLELGGGTIVFPDDVSLSVDLIAAFLGRSGFLEPGDYEREPTPPEMVWMSDARLLVYAPGEGAFYPHTQPGADFAVEEPFGFFVELEDLHPRPMLAPTTGKLIYLRTRNRVPKGGTLAMFLPRQR
jgi:predicted deacylase